MPDTRSAGVSSLGAWKSWDSLEGQPGWNLVSKEESIRDGIECQGQII